MKKLVVILMIVLGSIVSISNIFYSYSVYKGWGHVGNGTEGIISNGLTIVTLAVTVWMGITIYNTVEKNEIEDLKDTIKDYSPLSDKVKEYAKQQLLNQLYKTGEISSDYLAKKFSEDEEIPIERYSDILTIDILMEKLYVNSANVSVQQKREWADAGIEMINKYKGRHKKRYDLERYYLDYREGDFYFYLGNSMKVKDAVDMYSKALRAFTKAVSECHIDINLDMSEFQKLSKKEQRIVVYFANAIGQCQACIMQSEKEGSERYNAYLDKALTNLQYATQMAVYCGRREVYYRNYGCFLENTSHDEDERLSQAYEQYKRAFKVDATCVKTYHVIISNLNRRIRNKLGIQARYPHQARTINICDMDFNDVEEKKIISNLIDEMKRYIELAIRLFPTNSIWYGFLTYCVIYQVCIQQNGCFKNNTEAMEQLKVCADKITILNGEDALCIVAQDEIKDINNYCIPNKVCNEENTMKTNNMTGYPSIDKPWMKYYDENAAQDMVFHTIYEKILENSEKYPQDVAILYYGNRITYKQLLENVDKCADALYSEGIREESCVTLCTSYVPEAIYIMIACSKIGAIANFINPLFKPDEMIARIKDTASKLFFIMDEMLDENMETVIAKSGIKTAVIMPIGQSMKGVSKFIRSFTGCISGKKRTGANDYEIKEWRTFLVEATDSAARVPYKENRGFIMVYSSGTTGASKGILLTEDGINATISSYNSSDFSYERGDTFYAVIPIWFSTGNVLSVLMPLCKGITIIPELLFDKERVVKGIIKYKPTMTLIQSKHNNIDLSSLQYPITGGEKVTKVDEDNITKFLESHKCSAPLLKGYGMCELGSTITTTTRNHNKPNSAGYPIKDVIVAAFDTDTNKELTYNERGEIRVNSPARMKEYFKNSEATKKFFFEDNNGQIWGCTGDIGYVDADGFVFIEGRASDCFFSENGKLIYLFDIEKVALQDVNVSQCKAINKEIHNRNIPVLHLALNSHMNIDIADFIRNIANKMAEELPKEAVPVYYKIWTSLPVHPNGKRDVEKLREAETGLYDANGSCIDL